MSKRVRNEDSDGVVEIHDAGMEYGCEWTADDGTLWVIDCEDAGDARLHAHLLGGRAIQRNAYVTDWTDAV